MIDILKRKSHSFTKTNRRGFTTVELVLVLTIMAITATLAADVISTTESNQRADRAAREVVAALRFARNMAMTTGNTSGVEFDTTAKTAKVYTMINSVQTWVTVPFTGTGKSGQYIINFAGDREILGVTMTVSLPSDTTNPYDVTFNSLGATTNTGTVRFSYSVNYRTVNITALADPTIN